MNEKTEVYQKKTIEAAINTIMTKMEEIYGANDDEKDVIRRRWIWELIQNATDCASNGEISIWISANEKELSFSHNGDMFTYDNLIDLITQISSKRINGDEKTGKFGTGFISTHLISEVVKVKGVYHRTDTSCDYKDMDLVIDRSGKNEQEVKQSIVASIEALDLIDASENIKWEFNNSLTTSFIYDLTRQNETEVQEAIQSGCKDLDRSIPFVFAFSNKIKEIHCNGITYSRNTPKILNENMIIIEIIKSYDNGQIPSKSKNVLLCLEKISQVSIATIIELCDDRYRCCSLENMPRLFCSFPLIGTEDFSFPVIVNSPNFKVLQERNYIQEGAEINHNIIRIATALYKQLIEYANYSNYNSLFNLCYMDETKGSTLQKETFSSILLIYQTQPIVDTQEKSGLVCKKSLYSIVNRELQCNIIIPYMDKSEHSDELWDIINHINTKPIPTKESYRYWLDISPKSKITLQTVYDGLLKDSNITELAKRFTNSLEIIPWLNNFYSLWIKSSGERNFRISAIVPNQYGQFVEISKLDRDNNIDDTLKEVLTLLGTDIKAKLLHKGIIALANIEMNTLGNEIIADKINDYIRKQLSNESSNTTKRTRDIQNIFNMLTDWFTKNSDMAKPLFKDIYDKQYQLSTTEETIRRLELAITVESAMIENKLELEQLTIVLKESGKLLQMFENGEIMLSEDAQKLFHHISSKSPYAAERLKYLIERSINSVYNELSSNPLYSVDGSLDEWKQNRFSTTVFNAMKDNKYLRIVIRPSDDDKIIFYEDAELEALDDTAYELWTDNENGIVRMITLGDLIKTTGISTIPLKKIF